MSKPRWAIACLLALLLTVGLVSMKAYAEEASQDNTTELEQVLEKPKSDSALAGELQGSEQKSVEPSGEATAPAEETPEAAEPAEEPAGSSAESQETTQAPSNEMAATSEREGSAEKEQSLGAGNDDRYAEIELEIYYYTPDYNDPRLSEAHVALYQVASDGTETLLEVRTVCPMNGDGANQWEEYPDGKRTWRFHAHWDNDYGMPHRTRCFCVWGKVPKYDANGNKVNYKAYLSNADGSHSGANDNVTPEGYVCTSYYGPTTFGIGDGYLHCTAVFAYNTIGITVDKTWTTTPHITPEPPIVKAPRPTNAGNLKSDPAPSRVLFDAEAYLALDPDNVLDVGKGVGSSQAELALYQNGVKLKTITLTADGTMSAHGSFGDCPVADSKGAVYHYEIKEETGSGTFIIDTYHPDNNDLAGCGGLGSTRGTDLTYDHNAKSWRLNAVAINAIGQGTTAVGIQKMWLVPEQDVPEQIKVKLLANGKDTKLKYVLGEGNRWMLSIEGLPAKLADGTPIKYTVKEADDAGFSPICSSVVMGSRTMLLLVNTKPTSATVKKVWDDGDDADGKRPAEVEVQLQWKLVEGDGKFNVGGTSVDLSSVLSDSWKNVPSSEELKEAMNASGASFPDEFNDLAICGARETSLFKLNEANGWTITESNLLPSLWLAAPNTGVYPEIVYRFTEVSTVDDYESEETTETVKGEDGSTTYTTQIVNTHVPTEEPEKPTDDTPSKPTGDKPNKPAKPSKQVKRTSVLPKTGDMASEAPVVLLGAGLACLVVGRAARRKTVR